MPLQRDTEVQSDHSVAYYPAYAMGVPGFFAWLRRKYPQIVEDCALPPGQSEEGSDDRECDNLYRGEDLCSRMRTQLAAPAAAHYW